MSEARIGRIVVAALHEALAAHVPLRLDFYESYLRPMSIRAGRIGIASFSAALSFLRAEEDGAYDAVTRMAGRLAAEWLFLDVALIRRVMLRRAPASWRSRAALRMTAQLAAMSMQGAKGRVTSGPERRLVVVSSPFCDTRQRTAAPRCGFYAAALERFGELLGAPVTAAIVECRSMGHAACALTLAPRHAAPDVEHDRAEVIR